MTLTLPLTPEEQARLEARARTLGLSLDAFVRTVLSRAASEAEASMIQPKKSMPLPMWPGYTIGQMRREDIYEDVR